MQAPSTYSIAEGRDAQYTVRQDGKITVNIKNVSPMKLRAVNAGAANIQFGWVFTRGRASTNCAWLGY